MSPFPNTVTEYRTRNLGDNAVQVIQQAPLVYTNFRNIYELSKFYTIVYYSNTRLVSARTHDCSHVKSGKWSVKQHNAIYHFLSSNKTFLTPIMQSVGVIKHAHDPYPSP